MALIEGCKHSLSLEIPADAVAAATEIAAAGIQAKVRLPGFRPGKAPLNIVKSRFAAEIRQEALDSLLPKFFTEAVKKEHLEVVSQPTVKDLHFHAGEPVKFVAEFEVAPTFDLGEYRGLVCTYSEPEVTEEDLTKRIDQLRDSKAEFVNEEPRALVDGDHASISLESLSGVDEKVSQDELTLKLGDEHTLKEFTEALRGAAPGDVRELEVTYPEDYERKTLAGRTVKFQATVKAVRKRELPELNDEFAKDLGDFQTLEELRDMIRKTILREKESKAAEDAKTQLLDKLVEAHPFPVPEVYIDRQIENNVNQQFGMLQAQGVDVSKLQLDWTRLREAQKDRATKDVKASLLIDKIADREALAATQEEVDKEVQKIARQRKEAPAVTRANLQKDGTIGRIANHIRTEKALNFLFEQSRKEAPKAA